MPWRSTKPPAFPQSPYRMALNPFQFKSSPCWNDLKRFISGWTLTERVHALLLPELVVGQENAEKFANKMGRGRVKIVHPPLNGPPGVVIKDACDALRYHLDIRQMIESATLLPHSQIMTFKELKEVSALDGSLVIGHLL